MSSRSARALVGSIAVIGLVAAAVFLRQAPPDYGITAIDYHFHDAHPTLPIGPGRDLVVENDGRNVHNVTIPSVGYSHDIKPGQQIRIPDIAGFLGGPGAYTFYCKYHANLGMRGTIVIES